MKFVRNKYHYAVRKTKKLADSLRAEDLFEQAKVGDVDLLQAMKRIKGSKKQKAAYPDHVDDAYGDEISDMFKKVYEELYNSAESVLAMQEIKMNLETMIGPDSIMEVNKVT